MTRRGRRSAPTDETAPDCVARMAGLISALAGLVAAAAALLTAISATGRL
ncbi:hypothetical protein [Micromonospora sp. MA102]|nr:hypothetical protein [Micromonospora sp. MA102]